MFYIDDISDLKNICKESNFVALLYYSDWCPYSMIAKNSFNAMTSIEGVVLGKVRTDVATPDITRFSKAIPEIIIINNNTIIEQFNGVLTPKQVQDKISNISLHNNKIDHSVCFKAMLHTNREFTAYGSKGKIEIYKNDEYLDYIIVDRTSLNIILFFEYINKLKISDRIIYNGKLTKSAMDMSVKMKRDLGVYGMLHGIDNLYEKKDKKYIQKQISRINKLFQIVGPPFIVRSENGDYTINNEYSIEVLWS